MITATIVSISQVTSTVSISVQYTDDNNVILGNENVVVDASASINLKTLKQVIAQKAQDYKTAQNLTTNLQSLVGQSIQV